MAKPFPEQRWLETTDTKTKDVIIGHDGQLTNYYIQVMSEIEPMPITVKKLSS